MDAQRIYLDTLEPKHDSIRLPKMDIVLKYFFPNIARFLDSITCAQDGPYADGGNYSIALQTGTWDLKAAPLRLITRNPAFLDGVLTAVTNLAQRSCSRNIHLVFVLTMPYPACNGYDLCYSSMGHRNNHAIAALNEEFVSRLAATNYPSYSIVDATSIIRGNRGHSDCINHFLCRHGGRQSYRVFASNAGAALASETMRALCDNSYGTATRKP